ncbi:MAG: YihY/virulence factor BrkB family protein [Aeromicrobium sp.]
MATKSTVLTAWKQASAKQAPLLAAGVAFYTFLSLFPALIAAVLAYGLVASPETVAKQSAEITEQLPADAASLITGQLDELTSTPSSSLGLGLILALALAIYSASSGVGNLLTAINAMFGLKDDRSFIKRKLLALGLTLGAIVFLLVLITLVAAAPAMFDAIDIVPGVRIALEAARWALLLGAVVVAIGTLFRIAPNRAPSTKLVSKGVLVAALMWVLVSVGFSLFVDNFGSYGKTYGALAGVVVLLLWLWIGLYAILLGATIEAVREDIVTQATVAEDEEIAEWRTYDAENETVAPQVVYEEAAEAPAPEPEQKPRRRFNPFRRRRKVSS